MASFIYLEDSEPGFNQSHFYQHTKSSLQDLKLDSATREWNYGLITQNLFIRNTVYPFGGTQEGEFTVSVNGDPYIRSACVGNSLIFNIFDGKTFRPWKNVDANGNNLFLYGSGSANCQPGRQNNIEFSYTTSDRRKKIMDFMDSIPIGAFVVVRSIDAPVSTSYSATWRADTSLYGSNNSLYHKLLNVGFTNIDELNERKSWILVYQKGINGFQVQSRISQGLSDKLVLDVDVFTPASTGNIISPSFGPAKAWKELKWTGEILDNQAGDEPLIDIVGIDHSGNETILVNELNLNQQTYDISFINAAQYPFVKLVMKNTDTINFTPYQLDYWRLTYDPVPEGAIAPNYMFEMKDSLEVGEPLNFKVAFKNVSQTPFDSLLVKMIVTDENNVSHIIPVVRQKPLVIGDSVHVSYKLETTNFSGKNTLFIDFNPDDDQPEQHHFNNFLYKDFIISRDSLNPLLDVTFDGVHILNRDIVSAKPKILIKLQDEAKFLLLDDTSLVTLKIRYPNGNIRPFYFNNDSVRYIPPTPVENNEATIEFNPSIFEDGDYELIVSGKDRTDNQAGNTEYRVSFQVINKPMISNMLNYPNPFTTSTAFVFTLTGSEVPQNLRIQIMTITGKIVREITKEELGPIHIGRNITDFKWDGTDQYGQKLANGIYLYRVITNLNGKLLDKYRAEGDRTDQYFNKGYGKMYLMR